MKPPLVAVTDSVFASLEPTYKILAKLNADIRLAKEPTPDAILEVAREADALLVTYANITSEIINELENCRVIARCGIGVDNIDLDRATEAGIQVCYVPDYCLDEVSDHTMSLLLSLARKITFGNQQIQNLNWKTKSIAPVWRIRDRILGLYGFGKIPQALVAKAQAFNLIVIAHDPYISNEFANNLGVELVSFESLLEQSDYISIHAPLTPETHHAFNADAFLKMKPETLLINTARGALVDEQALASALDEAQLAGAALDVLETEPPLDDSPLLKRDNVILTPHKAFYSEEALLELQTKAAEDVARVLSGDQPRYPINKPSG
ncbi:MAG: hydroxyacid dehydrogenase [Gammaproteobacteria bacterium]|nr:hydroxyacid dehydrogenase [Gammaproteobacteria bacterium]